MIQSIIDEMRGWSSVYAVFSVLVVVVVVTAKTALSIVQNVHTQIHTRKYLKYSIIISLLIFPQRQSVFFNESLPFSVNLNYKLEHMLRIFL